MLTISETLAFHRRTRSIYMDAARKARFKIRDIKTNLNKLAVCVAKLPNDKFVRDATVDFRLKLFGGREFHKAALLCFIRRARLANRRLIDVKRFARQMSETTQFGHFVQTWNK